MYKYKIDVTIFQTKQLYHKTYLLVKKKFNKYYKVETRDKKGARVICKNLFG